MKLLRLTAFVASLAISTVTGVAQNSTPVLPELRVSANEPSLRVVDDLELDLLLREPVVANPLYMTFDERGRLWVVQYRQYPWPAGLKLLSRDSVWRNVYDPPFAPPPPHADNSPFRGKDLITIHEDSDGNGSYDSSKVFLDGLNFATAALPGRGGVFVLNPPYLLFYADRDRDDRPDSVTPQTLLSGFGIEDSHSIANSLRWGPDGWIYAAQGSTVSGSIVTYEPDGVTLKKTPVVHSLGQNIWRYHPERHEYEIFAEGGGNAFGVEIDQEARIYSGHNGGDTRGFHYVQGGYWQKNFGKHGQLSNPYAFDYHQAMRHHPVVRFTHTFTIYQAHGLATRYEGQLFGVNPVEHNVVVSSIEADGSSRKTHDLGIVVAAGDGERDRWFTPVDIQTGPDGALYIADWYSVQPNHYRNHEGQTNPDLGRIYRLRGPNYKPAPHFDLASLSSTQLIDQYVFHKSRWYREQARRILADRHDASVAGRLWDILQTPISAEPMASQQAMDAFWALYATGSLDKMQLAKCLVHPAAGVRRAALHVLGDNPSDGTSLQNQLLSMAIKEPDVEVRCQLAATAKRLPAAVAIPVVFALLQRTEDASDVYIPKTLWWSLEAHADESARILSALAPSNAWESPFRAGGMLIPQNLMRRYALAGRQSDLNICAELLRLAPTVQQRELLIQAFVAAHAGRPLPALPTELAQQLARTEGPFGVLLAVRQQDAQAISLARRQIVDDQTPVEHRIALIQALGDIQATPADTRVAFTHILGSNQPQPVKTAVLVSFGKYNEPEVASLLLETFATLPNESQAIVIQVLASRQDWALQLLQSIEAGSIETAQVDPETVARLRRHSSDELHSKLEKLFPQQQVTVSQREARMETLQTIIRQGQGAPLRGRELFHGKAGCGKCHRLFVQGGEVGPDLTAYNRSDLRQILLAVANPSAEIREGFGAITVTTQDGRVLSGLKIEENNQLLVLRGTDGQDQRIPTDQIDEIIPNPSSLMPDGLLDTLTDDEIRDLFAFLSSTTPPL